MHVDRVTRLNRRRGAQGSNGVRPEEHDTVSKRLPTLTVVHRLEEHAVADNALPLDVLCSTPGLTVTRQGCDGSERSACCAI